MSKHQTIYLGHVYGDQDKRFAIARAKSDYYVGVAASALGQICTALHQGEQGWMGGRIDDIVPPGEEGAVLQRAMGDSVKVVDRGDVDITEIRKRLGEMAAFAVAGTPPSMETVELPK